ncbi:S-4TM family putative pore-forming effector [Psychrobacter sp. PAMC 21119]|uniref:S-4TM family putative pore-forming effector n=1 Tax=Psychrobacter sp. PAMC 21119 TaxID=1112209 RepID=UPI0002881CAB|nr:S-4TM family putative pore-forming effector [Psychrobacter sp. PAMC 21119]
MTNISERQNEPENIKKLQAQSQLYTEIKFIMILNSLIGVGLPVIVSFLIFVISNYPSFNLVNFDKNYATYISAFIGFISVTSILVLNQILKSLKGNAAKVQEMFDTNVFDLPWDNINIGKKPNTELIFKKSSKFANRNPNYTGFTDWYTAKAASFEYPRAIAFCQQQNLCWDTSLRNIVIVISTILLILILLIVFILGWFNNVTLRNFITNFVLISLPICVFFFNIIVEHKETISEIDRLREINENLIDSTTSNNLLNGDFKSECRKLQTAIYIHRKTARPIPDWLHRIYKDDHEGESDDRMQQYLNDHQ